MRDRGSESRMQLSRKKIVLIFFQRRMRDIATFTYFLKLTNHVFYFQKRKQCPMQKLVIYKLNSTEEFLFILSNRNNGPQIT